MGNRLLMSALVLAVALSARTACAEYENEAARAQAAASLLSNSQNPYNPITQPAQFSLYQAQKTAAQNAANGNKQDGQTVRQDDPQTGRQQTAAPSTTFRYRVGDSTSSASILSSLGLAPSSTPAPDSSSSSSGTSTDSTSGQSQGQGQSGQTSSSDPLQSTSTNGGSSELTVKTMADQLQGSGNGCPFNASDPLGYALSDCSKPIADPQQDPSTNNNPYKIPSLHGGNGHSGAGTDVIDAVVKNSSGGHGSIADMAGGGSSPDPSATSIPPVVPTPGGSTLSVQSTTSSSGGSATGQSTTSLPASGSTAGQ